MFTPEQQQPVRHTISRIAELENLQKKVKIGDLVVVFYNDSPLCHNSSSADKIGGRGERSIVTKIGRKYISCTSNGADIKCSIDDIDYCTIHCCLLEDAKKFYREGFDTPGQWRTAEFIDECVAGL